MSRYIIVGGNPTVGYTGTMSFTGLNIVASTNWHDEIVNLWDDNYDRCGGLMVIIDCKTGKVVEWTDVNGVRKLKFEE